MTDKRILVIEDEFLVALEIQSELQNAGFGQVEHTATEADALKRIHESHWDAAVADANLNGCGMGQIVAALNEHHIPFVIVSGYGRESLPPEVAHIELIDKPFHGPRLVQTVVSLCRAAPYGELHT